MRLTKTGVNTEDSISTITFFGPQFEFFAILTHSERFSLWTLEVIIFGLKKIH